MSLTTVLFLAMFFAACIGAAWRPMVGICAYMLCYMIYPESRWWGQEAAHWGLRYSYMLALATALGIVLRHRTLTFGTHFMQPQEWALLAFVGVLWLTAAIQPPLGEKLDWLDYPPLKVTKIVIFAMLLTHVVTNMASLNWVLWTFVGAGAFLGYQAYTATDWMFLDGRLNSLGGPDFHEACGIAVFLGACLPCIGLQFVRHGMLARLACLAAGVLSVNSIILTRTRGGLVAVGGGALAALLLAPRRYRLFLAAGLVVAAIGAYALTDVNFWERMETITVGEQERDRSAQSRIEVWRAAFAMFGDYPWGVGPGNFAICISPYHSYEEGLRRDAHNAWIRCMGELGVQGLLALACVVGGAILTLVKVRRQAKALPPALGADVLLVAYGMALSLLVFLLGGLTWTNLYTEALWWWLALPVCLMRAVQNAEAKVRVPSSSPLGQHRALAKTSGAR